MQIVDMREKFSGGAAMPADRVTRNSFGRMATMMMKMTTMAAMAMRMMCSMGFVGC
jgi:hypothetical protein